MLIRRLQDCDEFIGGDDSILRELLHPAKAEIDIRYSLAHATVKPGDRTKPHRLKTTEVYYLLQGQGRMHIGDEAREVTAQSAIYIPPHAVQWIENTGTADLIFLCIVDPAWRREDEEIIEVADLGQIAVDVVLLPNEAMTSRAIEINRRLITNGRPEIVLNRQDCLPHISLAMGCIDEADMTAIQNRLESLARKTFVRQLCIVGVIASVNSRGETTSLLDVDRTEELQALHEQIMQEMMPFFRYEVSAAMIYDDVVTGTTLDWIRTYPQKAGYEHFRPHITIGYGRVPAGLSFPIPFSATRLALCHLGNHCTCRRVLAAVNLP
jgi:mannose-6-phosphate isomerase-like protein (cupin superfamily)/2'-5' RNA ligase